MTTSVPTRAPARRLAGRAGVVGLAVLTATVLGAGSAGAADTVTIPLDPADVSYHLDGVENHGGPGYVGGELEATYTPLPVAWGGEVVIQLPDGLDGDAMEVGLELAADDEIGPTRTLSSYSTTDPLTVTPGGPGEYTITLPADDMTSGPIGYLYFSGITSSDGYPVDDSPFYELEFGSAGPPSVQLQPQLVASAHQPCDIDAATRCAGATVTAGTSFAVTVPADSVLRELDHGTLETAEVVLQGFSGFSAEPFPISDDPARYDASGPWDATLTLPGGLASGDYVLYFLLGDPATGDPWTMLAVELQVLAAQAAPVVGAPAPTPTATPAPTVEPVRVNAGLRSNTGVEALPPVTNDSGGSAAVAVGAGLLLLSGVGGVVVRTRRRPAAEVGTTRV
jgi:hypothetical protein